MKKVRSAKGEYVDFDLIKIKEQMASDPAPLDVRARQEHIDSKLRRRMRKVSITPIPAAPTEVAPKLPAAKAPEVKEELIDPPVVVEDEDENLGAEETETSSRKTTRQKARPKKSTD